MPSISFFGPLAAKQKKNTWFILVYDGPALYKENCALGLVEYVFFPYRPPTQ